MVAASPYARVQTLRPGEWVRLIDSTYWPNAIVPIVQVKRDAWGNVTILLVDVGRADGPLAVPAHRGVAVIEVGYTCECDAPEGRRLYSVTGHDGAVTTCAYCEGCAALAAVDWNGETARIAVAS